MMRLSRSVLAGAAALAIAIPLHVRSGLPEPFGVFAGDAGAHHESVRAIAGATRLANFGGHKVSSDARYLAHWIADSRDNVASEFVIVDKKGAAVYVFDADARLRATSPVLLGSAVGDASAPDIGERPLALVLPEERTTPAGRFVAERGHNARGEDVVWVDYDAAVSMHRVLTTNPKERRLERLATLSVDDNRISFGCINVPVAFYEASIRPIFAARRALVYVLPDVLPVQQVFGSYDVLEGKRSVAAKSTAALR